MLTGQSDIGIGVVIAFLRGLESERISSKI